jgi:hypothetical protein
VARRIAEGDGDIAGGEGVHAVTAQFRESCGGQERCGAGKGLRTAFDRHAKPFCPIVFRAGAKQFQNILFLFSSAGEGQSEGKDIIPQGKRSFPRRAIRKDSAAEADR